MSRLNVWACILALGLFVQLTRAELQLELVQVLLRHGDRTPRAAERYPNDPHDLSAYEPMGLGQLTNKGKMTEYRIGMMLRQRYDKFLGDIYHPADIRAVSTDADRTKMSLQLALAGLYPSTPSQSWNAKLPWLPIPTHYLPEKLDVIMKPHFCPAYQTALKEVRNSEEVRKKISLHDNLVDYLTEKTGMTMESSQVYELYNLITSQKSMNLTMPEWCTDDVYREMQKVVVLEYEIRSYTTQLKRLNGGMLIKQYIENMNIKEGMKNPRKMYLYSGHEVTIAAFARAHNLTEPKLPAYGSAILFEKLRDKNGALYVRMLHWTGVHEELITFNLPQCGEICPIDQYLKIVKDVIPSNEETNCLWNNVSKEDIRKMFEENLSRN